MEEILNTVLEGVSLNVDTLILALATGLGALVALALKAVFGLIRTLAKKTPTDIDDRIVDKTIEAFKEKSKEL